jgi:murein DD-endopeptidase MepM/ murein hydrolase activator NlpD
MQLMDPPGGRPWALLGLCGGSLLLNVVLITNLAMGSSAEVEAAAPSEGAPTAAVAHIEASAADAAPVGDPVAQPPAAEPAGPDVVASVDGGARVVRAAVERSFAYTFQRAVPEHADVVSAVYARLFFWDLDVRRDLQKGDNIEVAYTWDGELAHIPVASYQSKKLGKTLRAYKFQAAGDTYPSWWNEHGEEAAYQLVNGPLGSYEQVTSLLKDRPRHKGMDFKVPVGEPVVMPRAGKVVRTNWNFKYNGNCVEVRYDDGTIARFLHLSETTAQAGSYAKKGESLGLTGNTGRSTAPHLHYELEKNGRVVDPVDYHGVKRRKLPAGERAAFDAEVAKLDRLLAAAQ